MTIQRPAAHLTSEADADRRWRLLMEFLEEYGHEPQSGRPSLIETEPATTGDANWDALLAGIAEWLAARDNSPAPPGATQPERTIHEPWSPQRLASLR